MASWVKAYIRWLPSAEDISAAVAVAGPADTGYSDCKLLREVIGQLVINLGAGMGCQGQERGEGTTGEAGVSGWEAVHSSIRLVLLLLLSRAVWATAPRLLLVLESNTNTRTDAGSSSCSSSSRRGFGSSINTSASAAAAVAMDSSSGNVAEQHRADGRAATCHGSNSSATTTTISSSSGGPTSSSCSEADVFSCQSAREASTSSNDRLGAIGAENGGLKPAHADSQNLSLLGVGASVCIQLNSSLLQWHLRALGGRDQLSAAGAVPSSAASDAPTSAGASIEAEASSSFCPPDVACGSTASSTYPALPAAAEAEAGLSSKDLPPPAAAAAGDNAHQSSNASAASAAANGAVSSEQLPMRFSKLPQQGLPEGVVKLLEKNSSRWPGNVAQIGLQLEEWDVQQQVLKEVVELCEVLQQEVPCPVGCNNPHCLNLQGVSEIASSYKTCTGCGVARYCGRECQVGHWKVHKGACRRLQKGLKG